MKKLNKFLLFMSSITISVSMPLIALSCNDSKVQLLEKNNKELLKVKISQFKDFIESNKGSIALNNNDVQNYSLVVENINKELNKELSNVEISTFLSLIENWKNEIDKKIALLKTKKPEEILELANKKLTFSYPNIEKTKLKDADIEKIIKHLPKDFELSHYKAVINEETQDITIIYKLKMKNTDIVHLKNQSFELKGWAKTDEQIKEEQELKLKLEAEIKNLKVKFLDEKAYKNVSETNSIFNYEGKPNFVVDEYDKVLFNYELSNLVKKNENDYTIDITLSLKSDKNISKKATVGIDKEKYGKNGWINPHSLSKEQQIKFLEDEINKLEIYPYYSKDKTFLELEKYDKLTDKSYWKAPINHQLLYEFSDIKDNENEKTITVKLSFKDLKESVFVVKDIKIDLAKLGIDELNKIRKEKNQEPLEDQTAPAASIDSELKIEKINLINYTDSEEDNKITNNNGYKIIHQQILDSLEKSKLLILNNKIKNKILNEKDKFLVAQYFLYDNEKYKTKSEIFFYSNSPKFSENQNVFIFSKPEIENNEIKSIKVTVGSLTDINSQDYSNLSSKRIKILSNDATGEDELKRLELHLEIKHKKIHKDPEYNGEYTNFEDFDLNKLVYPKEILEGFKLIKPDKKELTKNKKQISIKTYYEKNGIKSYSFTTKFPLKK